MSDVNEGRKALEAAAAAWMGQGEWTKVKPEDIERMRTALKAYLAALPGWRLVPTVQTPYMIQEANIFQDWWRTAIDAAPPPPGLGDSDE